MWKLIFFLALVCGRPGSLQAQDSTLKRFESAVEYLAGHKDLLAEKWQEVMTKTSYINNEIFKSGMQFKVADSFSTRLIKYFDDSIQFYGHPVRGCDGNLLVYGSYPNCEVFEPYADTLAVKIIRDKQLSRDTDFVVGFSRPYGDYLSGEIWHKVNGQRYRNRFGEALRILFLFDVNGLITKVYFKKIFK